VKTVHESTKPIRQEPGRTTGVFRHAACVLGRALQSVSGDANGSGPGRVWSRRVLAVDGPWRSAWITRATVDAGLRCQLQKGEPAELTGGTIWSSFSSYNIRESRHAGSIRSMEPRVNARSATAGRYPDSLPPRND
jgi:hypothetical protein